MKLMYLKHGHDAIDLKQVVWSTIDMLPKHAKLAENNVHAMYAIMATHFIALGTRMGGLVFDFKVFKDDSLQTEVLGAFNPLTMSQRWVITVDLPEAEVKHYAGLLAAHGWGMLDGSSLREWINQAA